MVDEILIMHHSHTDIGYTHPQPVALELHARFIDAAIDLCERTADRPEASQLRWTCEATAPVLHWLQSAGSRQIERFRQLARAGRISGGAMWCNLTPLYSAEQIARSLYPVRLLRETLGLPLRVAINHDVNGLPWPITQLLRDADMELLIMGINIVCGGFPLSRPLVFRWQGSDGREILVFNGEHYGLFNHVARLATPSLDNMQEGISQYLKRLEAGDYRYRFAFLTATNRVLDNAPPDPLLAEMVHRWNAESRGPVLRFATPEMLGERIGAIPADLIQSHAGDWTDFWNFGCASSATEGRLNRQARGRLFAAEALHARQPIAFSPRRKQLHQRAIWHLNMYEEHTWGAAQSITDPDSDRVANQWAHKAYYAHEAYSLSEMLLRDSLEVQAANPAAGRGVAGVLVYNPTPLSRQACVPIPKNWLDGAWEHNSSSVAGIAFGGESLSKDAVVIGPLELPPWGVTSLGAKGLTVAGPSDRCVISGQRIQSPYFELTFDSARGQIRGLYRRHHERSIINAESEWPFFGYVQETVAPAFHGAYADWGGRDAFVSSDPDRIFNNVCCWNPQWPARRHGPGALRRCETFQAADGAGLILEFEAPGAASLRQTIKLCAHRPVVELQVSLRKQDIRTAEGIYFTLPLALAEGWKAHYDTANLPVELDQEQLPGAARDGITVGQWVALHDAQLCVTLACPDAPMVQIGDFAFGRCRQRVPRQQNPLLLAWPLNNYWYTNFRASQPGLIQFRYELTVQDQFDPLTCTLAGLEAANDVVVHPVLAGGPGGTTRLVAVSDPRLLVLAMKPAENGDGMVLRLANVTADTVTAQIAIPGRKLAGAAWSDPLERDGPSLPVVDGRVEARMPARRLAAIHLR